MPRSRIAAVLLAILLAASCSSDDDTAGDSTTTTTTEASSTTATADSTTTVTTTRPDPATTTDIEVATINVLHGLVPPISDCAEATDHCNAPARVDILWQLLEDDVGCPEIIALQEISPRWFELVPEKLPELCDGTHVLLTEDLGLLDQEMILTTLPVIDHARTELAGGPIWSAHWAQLDGGDGIVVDVFTSHYASNSYNPPCASDGPTCAPSCPADSDLGDCHPYETLDFLAERAAPDSLQLVVGDLNKEPDEPRIRTLLDAGFVDTHVAAGNPECPEEGGPMCTTGIGNDADTDYAGLDVAENVPQRRIDFVLARAPEGCTVVVEPVGDPDGDGTHAGPWASTPLAEPVEGLYWPSDHAGIQADVGLDCA